ncbi:MAG: Ig-like domain-containing protein [Patescibacteria group bacterium]
MGIENKKSFLRGFSASLIVGAFLLLPLFFGMSNPVHAQAGVSGELGATFGLGTADLMSTVISIVQWFLGFLGLIAVIMILYGGFLWMTARGDVARIDKAKKVIQRAIIGLIIVLLSWSIVTFIYKVVSDATSTPPLPAHCSDGIQNFDETGVDCGGVDCLPCGHILPTDDFEWDENETSFASGGDYATDVNRCSRIQALFNHNVDQASVDALWAPDNSGEIFVEGFTPVGSVEWVTSGKMLTFKHDDDLLGSDLGPVGYRLWMPKAVRDTDGSGILLETISTGVSGEGTNPHGGGTPNDAFYWDFQTGTEIDDVMPTITDTYPISDLASPWYPDQSVVRAPEIEISFNEAIDATTIYGAGGHPIAGNFVLEELASFGGAVVGTVPDANLGVEMMAQGFRIRMVPPNLLESWTWYRITIDHIEDLCGNPMPGPYVWEFQTTDLAPGVSGYYPTGSSECPDVIPTIVFNTQMFSDLVHIEINGSDGSQYIAEMRPSNINPASNPNFILGTLPGSPNMGYLQVADHAMPVDNRFRVFEFHPSDIVYNPVPLSTNTTYTVDVTTDKLIDVSTYLSQSWSFTTADAASCTCAPFITSISPNAGPRGECITVHGPCFQGTPANPASITSFTFVDPYDGIPGVTTATPDGSGPTYVATTLPLAFNDGDFARPQIEITYDPPSSFGTVASSNASVDYYVATPDTATGPCLFGINPSSGYHGTGVSLTGTRFNPTSSLKRVNFTGDFQTLTSWYDDWATTTVPGGAAYGINQVSIENDAGPSNKVPFEVSTIPPNEPVVINHYPICQDVCPTAQVGGTISLNVTASMLYGPASTVRLYECTDATCASLTFVPAADVVFTTSLIGGNTDFSINHSTGWAVDTNYRVVLTNAIQSSTGGYLSTVNYTDPFSGELAYSWTFKTKPDAAGCVMETVETIPPTASEPVGVHIDYVANARTAPDSCDPSGQILNANLFTWTWAVDDPLSRAPVPASVDASVAIPPNLNVAIATTVEPTGTDPVFIEPTATDGAVTETGSGELNVTTDPPPVPPSPAVVNHYPTCGDVCPNGQIGGAISLNVAASMVYGGGSTVRLYACADASCDPGSLTPVAPGDVVFNATYDGSSVTNFSINSATTWPADQNYRVFLSGAIADAVNGMLLSGLNWTDPLDGVSGYTWQFKTKAGAGACSLESVETIPHVFSLPETMTHNYYANARSLPDSCDPAGQILDPNPLIWSWDIRDPLSRVPAVASVDASAAVPANLNHAVATAIHSTVADPVYVRAQATDPGAPVTHEGEGEFTITADPPPIPPSPMVVNHYPTCGDVCPNGLVRGTITLDVLASLSYAPAGTVRLYSCSDPACAPGTMTFVPAADINFVPTVNGGNTDFEINHSTGWAADTGYRVFLAAGITDGVETLASINYTDPADSTPGYSWTFKTKPGAGAVCSLQSVETVPSSLILAETESYNYYANARSLPDSCDPAGQILDPNPLTWVWDVRDPLLRAPVPAIADAVPAVPPNLNHAVTTAVAGTGANPVYIRAQATDPGSAVTHEDEGTLSVSAGLPPDPQPPTVIDRNPLCNDVCPNGLIRGTISHDVAASMAYGSGSTVRLYSCSDPSCAPGTLTIVPDADITFTVTVNGGNTDFEINHASGWTPDTGYRVFLSQGITDGVRNLANPNWSDPFDGTSGYSWVFKTKPGADACVLETVDMVPSIASEPASVTISYYANARSLPDSCDPAGQIIDPYTFTWTWNINDPLARVPIVASVDASTVVPPNLNHALTTTLEPTGTDPVTVEANAQVGALSRTGSGELNITTDPPPTDPYPTVVLWYPECQDVCPNAQVGGRITLDVGASMSYTAQSDTVRLYTCSDPTCGPGTMTYVGPGMVTLTASYIGGNTEFAVNALANWPADTYYRVFLSRDIVDATYGHTLASLNWSDPFDSTPGYSWTFKTKAGSDPCALETVETLPPYASTTLGVNVTYLANGRTLPDSCDAAGQILNPAGLSWTWSYNDPFGRPGLPLATVIQDSLNHAHAIPVARTNFQPVQAVAGATQGGPIVSGAGNLDILDCTDNTFCRDHCFALTGVPNSSTCDLATGSCTPVVTSLVQNQGPIDTSFSVNGCYFGATRDDGAVMYYTAAQPGGVAAALLCGDVGWSDNQIIASMSLNPALYSAGDVVTVSPRTGSIYGALSPNPGDTEEFTLSDECIPGVSVPSGGMPILCQVVPGTAALGQDISLDGFNFVGAISSAAQFYTGSGVPPYTPGVAGSFVAAVPPYEDRYSNVTVPGAAVSSATLGVRMLVDSCPSNPVGFGVRCDDDTDCTVPGYQCCAFDPGHGENVCSLDALCSSGGPGDPCTDGAVCPVGPSCIDPANYSCLTDGGDCNCCCAPGQVSTTGLDCVTNQAPCDGGTRGLYCGCTSDADCGNPATIGCSPVAPNCCYQRPRVVTAQSTPLPGAPNVCLNAGMIVVFDQAMDNSTLIAGNIILQDVTGSTSRAITVTGMGDRALVHPDALLESNHVHRIVILGQPLGGVRSARQIALAGAGLNYDYNSDGVLDSFAWTFTTRLNTCAITGYYMRAGWATGSDFDPRVTPVSFNCAHDTCFNDRNTTHPGNNIHVYAYPLDENGNYVADSIISWSEFDPSNALLLEDPVFPPDPPSPNGINHYLTAQNSTGMVTVTVTANSPSSGTYSENFEVNVDLCTAPWPDVWAGDDYPFVDDTGNPTHETQFSVSYCREPGGLPLLNSPSVAIIDENVPSEPGRDELLKEFFFLRAGIADAIGIRVMENEGGKSPRDWYFQQFGPSAPEPQALTIDGYPAVRSGRTVYVTAWNVDLGTGIIYPNVYLMSYSDGASAETIEIYNRMLANWRFNANLTATEKAQLQRDMKRVSDLSDIFNKLLDYKAAHGTFPLLEGGTFINGVSTSRWPSWQETLGAAAGITLPVDPLNNLSPITACPSPPFDQQTCWDDAGKVYVTPASSHIYLYRASSSGDVANLYARLERIWYDGGVDLFMWAGAPVFNPCVGIPNATCNAFNYAHLLSGSASDHTPPVFLWAHADGFTFLPDVGPPPPTLPGVNPLITASFIDDMELAYAEFYIDGILRHTSPVEAGFFYQWDGFVQTDFSEQVHNFMIRGYDTAGNYSDASADIQITHNFGDTTPPFIQFINPLDGTTVSGTVQVRVTGSDNRQITSFQLDVTCTGGPSFGPIPPVPNPHTISYSWDTTSQPNGPCSLEATIYDGTNPPVVAAVTVNIDNQDTVEPAVTLTSAPGTCAADGAACNISVPCANTVCDGGSNDRAACSGPADCDTGIPCTPICERSGVVPVQVTATDNQAVTRVDFLVDGIVQDQGTEIGPNTYEWLWDTRIYSNGDHTLSVNAYDAYSNSGGLSVQYRLWNAEQDSVPPTVSFVSPPTPVYGSSVDNTITVEVDALDNPGGSGVQRVNFYLDYVWKAADATAGPYSWNLDTLPISDGWHRIQVDAVDNNGNRSESIEIRVEVRGTGGPLITYALVTPCSGGQFTPFNFTAVVTDPDGVSRVEAIIQQPDNVPIDRSTMTDAGLDTYIGSWNSGIHEGTFFVDIEAEDAAGNISWLDNIECTAVPCAVNGDACSAASDCCSGYCGGGGICAEPPACLPNGNACTANGDCCSNYCDSGGSNQCEDLPSPPTCPDGNCDVGEDPDTCPADCGSNWSVYLCHTQFGEVHVISSWCDTSAACSNPGPPRWECEASDPANHACLNPASPVVCCMVDVNCAI